VKFDEGFSTECGDEIAGAGSVTTRITVSPMLVADAAPHPSDPP